MRGSSRHPARFSSVLLRIGAAAAFLLSGPAVAGAEGPSSYVGTEVCKECHQEAYEAWADSHHSWAWREPTAENVLGDFSGGTFHHDGIDYRFTQESEGGYRVTLTDQVSQTLRDYAVEAIAGVAPLQQYLIETEPGRLQSFDVVWDVAGQRWYHLYPSQDLPPEDGLHWSGPYKNWNARCAECHATGFEKNYDPGSKTYQSRQAEIGVGCEACHGAGEDHLAWARSPVEYEATEGLSPYGFTTAFSGGDPGGEIEVCAPCHSRREPLGDASPIPGSSFADHYNLSLLRQGLYHPDGQILDEVYVYGSFLQSKMYAKDVRCSDCHEPHAAGLKAEGNAVCTQCHNSEGREGFPSLVPADYDSPAHHFHPEDSAGAACVSCHMIERVYMGIDGRRDHSFRVPRPDLSEETGSPNACTDCHEDRTADWAAAVLKDRYPQGRSGSAHYGQVFSAARATPGANNEALLALIAAPERAAIVRATALDLLARMAQPREARSALSSLMDPDPLVRHAALSLLAALPPRDQLEQALPLLDDPARSVRIEAARRLLGLGGVRYPDATLAKLRSALGEYQASLRAKADFPEIQLALGGLALSQRNLPAASGAFGEAVRLDPQLSQAWRMLGRIEEVKGRPEAALALLDQGLKANPGDHLLVLSKAQTLIAVREYGEAATLLETLLERQPASSEVAAELGSLYGLLGRYEEAEPLMLQASEAGYNSPELLSMLGETQLRLGKNFEAKSTLLLMQTLYPGHPLTASLQRALE